ncbi:hypothetical protein ACJX0J_033499, partial [Zea mays]
ADVFLWRNRNISAGVLGGATAIWILFELLGYHLLTFVCHGLIFSLGVLFLWSNASSFIHKSPPKIPEVVIPEDLVVNIAVSTRYEINRAFANLRRIALGRDIKKFLMVIAGLWLLSSTLVRDPSNLGRALFLTTLRSIFNSSDILKFIFFVIARMYIHIFLEFFKTFLVGFLEFFKTFLVGFLEFFKTFLSINNFEL